MPGTQIKFNGYYSLIVMGNLQANGTFSEPILFTSNNPNPQTKDWKSLIIKNSNTLINNCIIEYCEQCINCSGYGPTIINSEIKRFSYTGIYCESGSPYIKYNTIHDYIDPNNYTNQGIWIQIVSTAIIECNRIFDGSGYGIYTDSDIDIFNNIIYNINHVERGNGIATTNWSKANIRNNYIHNCQNGMNL
jgi:hypothetical protein